MMDERRRRVWAALELGPVWRLRGAGLGPVAAPARSEPVRAERADRAPIVPPSAARAARVDAVASDRATTGDPLPPELDGRTARIAQLPWPGLVDAVAGCTACGLCDSRRSTVFGVGPVPADWMLVGEAPGEQEDLRGEPFVGPAGRLLDAMLAAIGVRRERDAFIANVLKCRPPRNRDPAPEEVSRCEPFLVRQIELLQPRLIVVLGRFAAQSLLRSDASIATLRGRVHRYSAAGRELPVVVTYHPAYLLRSLPDKSKAWADLRLARRTFDALGASQ
jgi:uracil-DNA glycosylase family 4